MIRRIFWLTIGAALGVTGYRRLATLARSLTPAAGRPPVRRTLLASPGTAVRPARPVSSLRRARQVLRFAADVRDGMELYMERHPPRTPNTLGSQWARPARPTAGAQRAGRPDHAEDGR